MDCCLLADYLKTTGHHHQQGVGRGYYLPRLLLFGEHPRTLGLRVRAFLLRDIELGIHRILPIHCLHKFQQPKLLESPVIRLRFPEYRRGDSR